MANRVVPDRHGLINIGKLKENLVTEVELPAPGFAGGSYAVLLQRPREKLPTDWQEEIQRRVDERIAAEGTAEEQDIPAEEALDIILGGGSI